MSIVFLLLALPCSTEPVVGEFSTSLLVINEFMAAPTESSSETEGEWIEIYNRSGGYMNLSGWKIRNQSGSQIICGTYLIPPEGYAVLGSCADTGRNGGYEPDQVYSGFTIASSGSLTLLNPSGQTMESFSYGAGWPISIGFSCERMNPDWTVGLPSNWAASLTTYGEGDRGTPGARNSVYENSFASNTWAFIKAFVQ